MKSMKSIYPVYLKIGLIMAGVILSFMAVIQCQAQEVIITKKNGERIEKRVQGTSPSDIYFAGGSVALTDIDNVYIKTEGKVADNFASYLTKNNIAITRVEPKKVEVKKPVVATEMVQNTVLNLDQSIEKFRAQRQTGKGLQLIGILATSASIAMQSIYTKKYQDDYADYLLKPVGKAPVQKVVNPLIPVVGGGLAVIGFAIDFDAGNHLKRKN